MKYLGNKSDQQNNISGFIREVLGLSDFNLCHLPYRNMYGCRSSNGRLNLIKLFPLLNRFQVINNSESITLDIGVAAHYKWVFKEALYSTSNCTSGFGKHSLFFQALVDSLEKYDCRYALRSLSLVSIAYSMITFHYKFVKNNTQWELLIQRIIGQEDAIRISLQESRVPSRNISKSSLYSFKQEDELGRIGVQCAKFIKETLDEAYRKER